MKSLLTILALVLISSCSFAQGGAPPVPDNKPIERLDRLRKMRLIESLDLKEDQSVRFLARLNEQEKTRKELRKQRGELLDKVEQMVGNHASAADFDQVFSGVFALDQKLIESSRVFVEGLKDILTPEQRAKMLLFERHFENELRDAIREIRRHHAQSDQQ
jgi:hypothetical protein